MKPAFTWTCMASCILLDSSGRISIGGMKARHLSMIEAGCRTLSALRRSLPIPLLFVVYAW